MNLLPVVVAGERRRRCHRPTQCLGARAQCQQDNQRTNSDRPDTEETTIGLPLFVSFACFAISSPVHACCYLANPTLWSAGDCARIRMLNWPLVPKFSRDEQNPPLTCNPVQNLISKIPPLTPSFGAAATRCSGTYLGERHTPRSLILEKRCIASHRIVRCSQGS